MRKILLLLSLALFLVIACGRTTTSFAQQQPMCTTTVNVSSVYGATSGSGSYVCGASVTFGVSPTTFTDGNVRHVFSGWSCTGAGCYSGSADTAQLTTGGDNSVIAETALWNTEYLLTISSTPSGAGETNPIGSLWESPGVSVAVAQYVTRADWFFAYWSLDGQNAGSSSSFIVTMESPHSLAANFVSVNITSKMLNVTNGSQGVMRNPDGTFYRGDAFGISYNISVVGAVLPSNILVNANFAYPPFTLELMNDENDIAMFSVSQNCSYAPHVVTATPYLLNEVGNETIAAPSSIVSQQPFAVVKYDPLFAYITYMEYNNLSSSTYARPFLTLARYDGNAPSYSYLGNANTDPFNAYNATGERAIINNFSFSVDGRSVQGINSVSLTSSTSALNYDEHGNLDVGVQMLNRTYPGGITFHSVYKFYFKANLSNTLIGNDGIIYFNVTESAWYSQGQLRYSDFNTSYLYEPVFYNGYLVFSEYSIANYNISVVVHNPDPLDPYLIQGVVARFGNDSRVIDTFEQDLYPAYSSTIVLKPFFSNSTEVVFLVNQTNIMTPQSLGVPYFTISVRGFPGITKYQYNQGNPPSYLGQPVTSYGQVFQNITYNVNDEYSLFAMNDFAPPAPFPNFMGYFLAQSNGYQIVMQPISFSFTGPASYLARTYGDPQAPFFVTEEPGNLTKDYAMLYGQNVTIHPNFVGGGIIGVEVSREGNGSIFYVATIQIASESGGMAQLWVRSDTGQILYNETIASSFPVIVSFNPPGYVGTYMFDFPAYSNGTVSIDLNGSWGALNAIAGIPVTSNYGAPPSSLIIAQIMDIVWCLFVPILFVFWFAVVFFKLKSGETSAPSASYP